MEDYEGTEFRFRADDKLDPLEKKLKDLISALPEGCKPDDNLGSHEWIHAWGYYDPKQVAGVSIHGPTKMYPYFICKHCHAVSENFTTHSNPKRAR